MSSSAQVVAIVMDIFTDVDLLSEVLDAAARRVPVYILLDEMHAQLFLDMADKCRVNLNYMEVSRPCWGREGGREAGQELATGWMEEGDNWMEVLFCASMFPLPPPKGGVLPVVSGTCSLTSVLSCSFCA